MVRASSFLALLGSSATAVSAWEHLTAETFAEAVAGEEIAAVAFVDANDHGKAALETEWGLLKTKAEIPVLSIDCSVDADACAPYVHDPSDLPTIELLQKGTASGTYRGPRRASAVSHWISRSLRPRPAIIPHADLTQFKTIDESVCIAFLEPSNPSHTSLGDTIASLSRSTLGRRVSLGILENPSVSILAMEGLINKQGQKQLPAVKCFVNPEGGEGGGNAMVNKYLANKSDTKRTLSGRAASDAGQAALETFITAATRAVIGELSAWNYQEYLDLGNPMIFIFASTESERSTLRQTLQGSAINYASSLSIVTVDPDLFPSLQSRLGLYKPADSHSPSPDDAAEPFHPRQGDGEWAPEATPGKPVGVLVRLTTGDVWHYPRNSGFTVKELNGWGLKVKMGMVGAFRKGDEEWITWPVKSKEEPQVEAMVEEKGDGVVVSGEVVAEEAVVVGEHDEL